MKNRPVVSAYYFPNWHVDKRNESLHGKDWTEWEVVKCARPRFPGHVQPKIPVKEWGYADESRPDVMELKTDTAAKYGIDAFIFDWYYFQSGPYRERCLKEGFLPRSNRGNVKFAIMWANHDPVLSHPCPWKKPADHIPWTGALNAETFREGTRRCIRRYMTQDDYLRIDDGVYFEIYRPEAFMIEVGGMDAAGKLVEGFRNDVEKAGLGKLTLCGNTAGMPPYWDLGIGKVNEFCRKLGLDMVSCYGGCPFKQGFPSADYVEWQIKTCFGSNEMFTRELDLPFNPYVQPGWDSSPRTVQSDMYEDIGYPFSGIVVNDTPENYRKALELNRDLFESGRATGKIMNLSCWNEWTEGTYLEPDEQFGFSKLEAVRDVFGLADKGNARLSDETHVTLKKSCI
ncbi:MAG: hypothetical protein BWY31_01526 [Lentisphaerae bacterium ADurb.Bin242]|nr:MAG: hypothetical protein BWY31_01526 [Lentisphaerae bacterium ADurb.Bin242]